MTTTVARPTTRSLRHPAIAPLAVAALGFTISAVGIGIPSIWYDEAATITAATRSWPQLWAMLGNVDAVHGLYYFLMHVVFDVFGYSPLALRMPSALAIGVAAALVVVLGRQLGRPRLALIAGVVFCLLPRVTWAGTEGRSYALTAVAAVLLSIVFVKAHTVYSRRWWALYAVVAVVACILFVYVALVIVAHGVTVALALYRRDRMAVFFARRWAVATSAAGLVAAPFVLAVMAQDGQVAWIPRLGWGTVQSVFRGQWFYGSEPFAIVAWALIALGVIVHLRRRRGGVLLSTILPALLLPTVALLAVSLVHSPLYLPRYLTMCTPFVALAIALGIDAIRWRPAVVGTVVLIAALAVPQVAWQRLPEAKENASWAAVADLVAHERSLDGPDATTVFIYGNVQRHPSATARVMAYSYPDAFADSIDLTLLTPAAETAQLWETAAPIGSTMDRLDGADVAYLVTSVARDLRPQALAAMSDAGWVLTDRWELTSVRVLRFEPRL